MTIKNAPQVDEEKPGHPEPPSVHPGFVEITRIVERGKTVRVVAVALACVIGISLVMKGIVQIVQQPPWVAVVGIVVAALLGPSGVVVVLLRSRNRAIEKHHRRIVELEKRLHPGRTSSLESISQTQKEQDP